MASFSLPDQFKPGKSFKKEIWWRQRREGRRNRPGRPGNCRTNVEAASYSNYRHSQRPSRTLTASLRTVRSLNSAHQNKPHPPHLPKHGFFQFARSIQTWEIFQEGNLVEAKKRVVTGASEGIGKAYALELAKRGMNVVLMSRSEEKLNKVAAEIKEKYGRDTRVIPVDFSDGVEIYSQLAEELSSLDIGVLVNNVGFAYEYPDSLGNVPPERLYKVVQINCQPVVQMSRILLPKMTAKGGGVIVNISSSASFWSIPDMSVYSATKIYVNYVSDGIRKEYRSKGIMVQNVTPFVVATALSGVRRPTFTAPSAASYAKAAVATIGVQNDTFGCFSHAILGYVATRLPNWLADIVGRKGGQNIRERYFKKQAKAKAN